MKSIIQFKISKEDGIYIAEGIDIAVVTQADSLDELMDNIKEATSLHLEGENPEDFGFVKSPSLFVNFELGSAEYAKA